MHHADDPLNAAHRLRIGVDGGGSVTRARQVDAQGMLLGIGETGPFGLSPGIAEAWAQVRLAVERAFGRAWLGRRAVQHAQQALDGHTRAGPLTHAVGRAIGTDRTTLIGWCHTAGQGALLLAPATPIGRPACQEASR